MAISCVLQILTLSEILAQCLKYKAKHSLFMASRYNTSRHLSISVSIVF